jgi:TrbL/VirB6 plasmid conjugal transfer protein
MRRSISGRRLMIRLFALLFLLLLPISAGAQDVPGVDAPLSEQAAAPTAAAVAALGTAPAGDVAGTVTQFGLFAAMWNGVAIPITAGTQNIIGGLTGWVNGWFAAAVGAMLIFLMLQSAWNLGAEIPWTKYFHVLWLGSLCFWIGANAGTYNSWIVGPFNGAINGISRALTGAFGFNTAPVAAGSFDAVTLKMIAIGFKVFTNLPWYSPKVIPLGLLAIGYCFVSCASIAIMFAFFMCSFIIQQFCLAMGPIFVAAGFFPLTRPFFYGWFRATAAASLQMIFVVAVMTLFQNVLVNIMQAGIQAFGAMPAAGAGAGNGGDFASQCVLLIFGCAAAMLVAFLTYELLRVALFIAGSGSNGIFPRWQQFASATPGGGGGGPPPPGGGGGGGGPPPAPGGSVPRNYAFNRNVGSAS